MGKINLFNSEVDKFYLGESDCRIYLGDTLLYPKEQPSLMFTRTHLDGTVFEVECGESGSSLTTDITLSESSLDEISGSTNPATAITIGDCVTEIGNSAFVNWDKVQGDLIIPDSVTTIGNNVFQRCSGLTSVHIGSGVTSVGSFMFQYCTGLTSVNIPESITVLGVSMFHTCTSLKTITIPASVTEFGNNLLYNCSALTEVIVMPTTPPVNVNRNTFSGTNCPIYVPDASVNAYKTDASWKTYADRIKPLSEKP